MKSDDKGPQCCPLCCYPWESGCSAVNADLKLNSDLRGRIYAERPSKITRFSLCFSVFTGGWAMFLSEVVSGSEINRNVTLRKKLFLSFSVGLLTPEKGLNLPFTLYEL